MVKKALLIIDMQRGDFPPVKDRYKAKEITATIARLAGHFRVSGFPVIYIQHDGSAEGAFVPGTEAWQILPEIMPESTDHIVSKTANNAFYKSELDKLLKKLDIGELLITGSATDFCIESTVQAALSHDYNLFIVEDAHTTADRPSVKAQAVIDHYNWVWQNLTPTGGMVRTITSEEVLSGLL